MTAEFPAEIFEQRDLENVPGVTYDDTIKTRIFAEDLIALAAEITAIETILGQNVNGSYDTVLDWLEALEAGGGGGGTTILETVSTIDDSNLTFIFTEEPKIIYVNGIAYRKNHGWTWLVLTATLSTPVGSGGEIFGVK